jgi:hypothetical protein
MNVALQFAINPVNLEILALAIIRLRRDQEKAETGCSQKVCIRTSHWWPVGLHLRLSPYRR